MKNLFNLMALTLTMSCSIVGAQQSRTQAQGDGLSIGKTLLNNGPLTPSAQSSTATTQGPQNVWGGAYTGQADAGQTSKATSGTLFGVGNQARSQANSGFQGYSNSRDKQSNDAVYFLDKNPILKPTLSVQDPMFSTANLNPPAEFA
jgi:hypothetical protein